MNIYEYIGDKFFSPLASKNKYIYLDSILFLNNLLSELDIEQENYKQKAITALARHLEDVNDKLYNEENNDELYEATNDIDGTIRAQYIINKLIDFGWMFEEEVGNGKRSLNFTDYSLAVIKTIYEIQKSTKKQYTGYIRRIRHAINSFDYTKLDDLENIDDSLEELTYQLRSLYSNLRRYYKNITKNKNDVELKALLEEFTGDYKDNFFDSSYYNLKVRDKADNEIPKLIDELEVLFNDFFNMQKLVKARQTNGVTLEEASNYISKTVERILNNIKIIPNLIRNIDNKNEKYVNRTVSVILHKIKRGEDIEGILNQLIEYVKNDKVDNLFPGVFKMKHYTFDALAKPKNKSYRAETEILEMTAQVSKEAIEKAKALLAEEKKYNIDNVNKYVLEFLNGYKSRRISEANYNNKYDFLMIVSMMMYSALPSARYDITLCHERIENNGVSFNDFYVSRKDDR